MTKFCQYCGSPLNEGARFCTSCGHPVAAQSQQPQPGYPPQQGFNPQPPKKKNGLMYVLIGLVVVAAMAVSAFILFPSLNPLGQKNDKKEMAKSSQKKSKDDKTQLNQEKPQTEDDRSLNSEKPMETELLGNSDPLDYSPLEGFHITAEKNAFKENTTIKMAPLTTLPETALTAVEQIENEGYLIVDGYEVNAGLEDDELMPGEYTVDIDLSTLDVNPKLYPFLTVFRVGDDGSYYEYSSEVKDGKLVYRSDQNSLIMVAVVGLIGGTVAYDLIERGVPYKEYLWRKDVFYFRETYEGVTFTLSWAPKELGQDEAVERIKEITEKYEGMKDELYRKYMEDHTFEATNALQVYSRGKTVAEVVREAIENDEEIKELQMQLEDPEVVEYAIKCTKLSIDYLKNHQFVKMPTGVVEIVSVPGSSALATATSRRFHEGYIEISLKRLVDANQTDRNNFLLTMTHEMLHVCQQKYRALWADAIRYDELVAVFSEEDALAFYIAEGRIEEDAIPPLSRTDYWTTLKLPIDKYDGKEKDVMKHEGYNLGLFVKFLKERTGETMWVGKLMSARSYIKEAGASAPLMYAFGLTEQEFDAYYRLFIVSNKENMAKEYNGVGAPGQEYKKNEVIKLSRGGKYHVDVRVEGSYSSEIRGFRQTDDTPMNLVVVMDEGFAAEQPECLVIPVDESIKIPKGYYIPALDGETLRHKTRRYRDILEMHGALGQASTIRTTGYTLYVWDKPKKPVPSEDDKGHLVVKMPQNSVMAKDGAVDGYILTIKPEKSEKIEEVILPKFFEDEVKIDKKKIYGDTDLSKPLKVKITLCEFIRNDKDKILGEESDVVDYTIGGGEVVDFENTVWVCHCETDPHYNHAPMTITASFRKFPKVTLDYTVASGDEVSSSSLIGEYQYYANWKGKAPIYPYDPKAPWVIEAYVKPASDDQWFKMTGWLRFYASKDELFMDNGQFVTVFKKQ